MNQLIHVDVANSLKCCLASTFSPFPYSTCQIWRERFPLKDTPVGSLLVSLDLRIDCRWFFGGTHEIIFSYSGVGMKSNSRLTQTVIPLVLTIDTSGSRVRVERGPPS